MSPEATSASMSSAPSPIAPPPPAEVAAEPAPILIQVTIRKATNGLIVTGVYQQHTPGQLMRNLPQPEFVFATSADMLTWLKGQGWTL